MEAPCETRVVADHFTHTPVSTWRGTSDAQEILRLVEARFSDVEARIKIDLGDLEMRLESSRTEQQVSLMDVRREFDEQIAHLSGSFRFHAPPGAGPSRDGAAALRAEVEDLRARLRSDTEALRAQVAESQNEVATLRRMSGSAFEATQSQHTDDLEGLRQEQSRQSSELEALRQELGREVRSLRDQQEAASAARGQAEADSAAMRGQLIDTIKALQSQRTALSSEVEALQAAMNAEFETIRDRHDKEADGLRAEIMTVASDLRGQQGGFVEAVNNQLKSSVQASAQALHAKLAADVEALREQHAKSKTLVDALRGQQGHFMRQHSRDIEGLREQHLRLHEDLERVTAEVDDLRAGVGHQGMHAPSPDPRQVIRDVHRAGGCEPQASHPRVGRVAEAADGLGHTVVVGAVRGSLR